MKVNRKTILSVITMTIAAVMFTITISLSVITAEIADARLVLGLALCGALAGGINGFGRRMTRTDVSHSSFRGQRVIASLR